MANILDQYGNPIPTKPPERSVSSGAVALEDRYRSYPARGLTPQKLSAILREADDGDIQRQAELFEEILERDAYLLSLFQTRKLAATSLEWRITPADDSAPAKRYAEAWKEVWDELEQENLLLDLLDAPLQGVSMTNVAWVRDGGTWKPLRLEHIPTKALTWKPDVQRFAVRTEAMPMGELLEFGACIEHRYKARSGSPNRAGLGRNIAWLYLFKHFAIKDWIVYAEVYGQPYRLGKYDPSAGEDERQALENAVRSLGSDAAGVISRGTEIEIIEASNRGGPEVYNTLVEVMNREMAQCILGQTLTSSEGNKGTQALGNVHQQVMLNLIKGDVKAVAATLRRDLIRAFTVFNFGAEAAELAPYLTPMVQEPEDLAQKAKTLLDLSTLGLEIPEGWVRETFGVPEIAKGELTLAPRGKTPTAPLEHMWINRPERIVSLENAARDIAPGVIEGQGFTSALIGRASDAGREAFAPTVERVLAVVAQASSYDDALEKLLNAFPDLGFDTLQATLENSMKLAHLAGQFAARGEP